MEKPNISLSNATKITSIELIDDEIELIDIEVKDNHTFWISDNEIDWTLTHNSGAPDIDCVNENHLILMSDGTYKRADELTVGDSVLGSDMLPHDITHTHIRELHPGEGAYAIVVKADDGTMGWLDVVPRHKFVLETGDVVYADEMKVGQRLMSTCGVTVVEVNKDWMMAGQYVDVTVEGDHKFHIVPFDVNTDDELAIVNLQRIYS